MEQLRGKTGFLIDMDGVIYQGRRLLPGAREFVDWLYREGKRFLFLTNSSCYTPRELHKRLSRMGLEVDESRFYTSALATASFIAGQMPGAGVYAVGEHGLLNALYDAGISINEVDPDYVVIGETAGYHYDNMVKAMRFVNQGARLIGTNYDLTGPVEDRLPGSASFVFECVEGESILLRLDNEGICASSGSACSSASLDPSHVLLAIGLPHAIAHGSLRLSLGPDNTEADVDAILKAVPQVVEYLRAMSPVWDAQAQKPTWEL